MEVVRQMGSTSKRFWLLTAFLVLVFLTGGGSRAEAQSLLILRPVSVLVCGVALWTLRRADYERHRRLFWFACAVVMLCVVHLVPLPPMLWHALPGRSLLADADKLSGMADVWRPLSAVPSATWNALYSLSVPAAVLLLSVQLDVEHRHRLLLVILGLGIASGFLGLLQVVGGPDSPLYFYQFSNAGSAIGLFANRNHQAIFLACLFPMLALFASSRIKSREQAQFRTWIALAFGVVLVPLLLISGSRIGLVVGLIGLMSVPLLYRRPKITTPPKRKLVRFNPIYAVGGLLLIFLGLVTTLMVQGNAFERIFVSDQLDDLRFRLWVPITKMVGTYFPFGSGLGSFVEAYQIEEPRQLLAPTFINHAHNDWIEVVLTAGLPGAALLIVAVIAWSMLSRTAWRRVQDVPTDVAFARMGSVILAIFALGSLTDYPLRVPSLMCVAVVAWVWLSSKQASDR